MADRSKEEKQYGLVLPGKNRLAVPKPGNIFGDDSGSDADDGSDWVKKALKAEGEKNLVKKQTQLTMKRALKEDPTVYQYDEVYDDIERSKAEEKINKKTVEKKAKYIDNLLKAADRRKREQEHRVERMVQKEREAEGAMFADKESFVTSAYRAKLEEFKKMEDEEKRMDRLESIGDVTKQQDMSGFYRHLYHQTVDVTKETPQKDKIKEKDSIADEVATNMKSSAIVSTKDNENIDGDDPLTTDSEQSFDHEIESNLTKARKARQTLAKVATKRQYRKRMAEESQSSSENEPEEEKTAAKSSTDKKSGEDKREGSEKKIKLSSDDVKDKTENMQTEGRQNLGEEKLTTEVSAVEKESEKVKDKPETETNTKPANKIEPEVPKISIWEKRTVGPVFEAALERYYARKAARSVG